MLPPPVVVSEVVSVVASRVASEFGSVVLLELGGVGTPIAVPAWVLAAATKAVASPYIVKLHPLLIFIQNIFISNCTELDSHREYFY